MPDYKQGKIYTIRSPNTDKYYIGSTTQPLHKRFYEHKRKYENGMNETTAAFVFDYIDAYIELLEECSCNSKYELDKREGELIREHKDKLVNKKITGRTVAEYNEDNKDRILERRTKYYEDNKDRILEQRTKYYEDNKEHLLEKQTKYHQENREQILIRMKKYKEENKEKLIKWREENKERKKEYDKLYRQRKSML